MTDKELAGLEDRSMRLAGYYDSISLPARDMTRLLARLDAERSRADTAEAERDAAVARERGRCEREARRYAGFYPPHSDGRNTFAMLADFIAAGRPSLPTPTAAQEATDAP